MYLNGRTGGNGPGGFARFHHEVSDRLSTSSSIAVLEPPERQRGPVRSRWWEQRVLLDLSRDGALLSTANNGPVRHPNQAVVVHDLLPLTHPHTVSQTFAAIQRIQLPRLCRNAAAVLTVSHHVAGQLETVLGVDRANVTVVRPGISDVFHNVCRSRVRNGDGVLGLDPERPVVAALASSIPRKNSATVLEVLAEIASVRPEVQVVVAGFDGPRRVFGKQAVRPTNPAVRDLGPVDDNTLAQLFAATDVFVSLTEAEGFGLPPLEALAAGTAVVSTSVPSLAELLPGVVAEVDDGPAAVAAAIDLLDHEEKRSTQVTAAASVVAHLTWSRTAAAVEQVLRRLEPHDH